MLNKLNQAAVYPGMFETFLLFFLYSKKSQENLRTERNFFLLKFRNFLNSACSVVVFSRVLVLDIN